MKRIAGGVLIALAVLALAGVIASQARNSQASDALPPATDVNSPNFALNQQDAEEDSSEPTTTQEKRSFIGVTIGESTEDGESSGVVVHSVLKGGPSDGILLEGDIITAINGEAVENPGDVVELIQATQPGDVVEISIMRDGVAQTVSVTTSEREAQVFRFNPRIVIPHHQGIDPIFGQLTDLADKLVRAEVVVETDDGFKTYQAVAGTVKEEVAEASNTFTIVASDDSEFTYTIDDETMVLIKQQGSLEGLNTTDKTYVLSVVNEDGTTNVKVVAQGDFRNFLRRHSGKGPSIYVAPNFQFRGEGLEELREMRERLQQGGPFLFNGDGSRFEFDLEEFLKELPLELDEGELSDTFDLVPQ